MKKKMLISFITMGMMCSLFGCSKKNNDNTQAPNNDSVATEEIVADTLGNKLASMFKEEIKSSEDIEAIANKLAGTTDLNCVVSSVSEGYLNGFDGEIKGFTKGVSFAPMIGSIPFVGYIFQVDNGEAFKETLLKVANPRWNVCTSAEETICVVEGNYVFFTMCPGEDQLAE